MLVTPYPAPCKMTKIATSAAPPWAPNKQVAAIVTLTEQPSAMPNIEICFSAAIMASAQLPELGQSSMPPKPQRQN